MKNKTKVLVSSFAAIALSASLITGATYALFTSESTINIAVSSGTVDVRAYIDDLDKSGSYVKDVTISGNEITINRMVPTDVVSFDIEVENYSDIPVQYRTIIHSVDDTGLFSALTVTFTENEGTEDETSQVFAGGYSYADWALLPPQDADPTTAEPVKTIGVTVEFPDSVNDQNYLQGQSCKFAVVVEAVQGNAEVVDPIDHEEGTRVYYVNDEKGMMLVNGIIQSVKPNEAMRAIQFVLTDDVDMSGYTWSPIYCHWVNFDGQGHTISNLTCGTTNNGKSGFAGYLGAGVIENVTFKNVTAAGAQAGIVAGQAEDHGSIIDNVIIDGVNTVDYVPYQEAWHTEAYGGVGAIVGHNNSVKATGNVTIASGAKVTVNYNDQTNKQFAQNGDKYAYANKLSGTITDNGTVTTTGNYWIYVADGMGLDEEGNYVVYNEEGLWSFAEYVNNGNSLYKKTVLLNLDVDLANEEWTPIGNGTAFQGTFDGQGHTISNLYIESTAYYIGLFGSTNSGAVKNVNVNNARIIGRSGVGVIAGNPYTSDFTNIKVTGDVKIDAAFYVGGVVGRNSYGDLINITVDVNEGSYVKADSLENGTNYRTYVGGIVGFKGEGGSVNENLVSNIDVIGTVCDIGGITGIAHYGNIFRNCVSSGNVTNTVAANEDNDWMETGGIAGVWNNGGADVVIENCSFTGTLTTVATDISEYPNGGLVGKAYSSSGTGSLILNGTVVRNVNSNATLVEQITSGSNVSLTLGTGTYTLPSGVTDSEVTINGTKDTVVDLSLGSYQDKNTYSFNGVTIKGSLGKANGNGSDYAALYSPNVTYTNCYFDGGFRVGRDGAKFIGCTFDLTATSATGVNYVWAYGNDVSFEGCTFNTDGKALLLYTDGGGGISNVSVKDCIFNSTKSAYASAIATHPCAAIEIQNYGDGVNLTTSGNTIDEDFSGEWRIKAYHNTAGYTITINGTVYDGLFVDGKAIKLSIDGMINACVDGVWYVDNATTLKTVLTENVEKINVVLVKSINLDLDKGLGGEATEVVNISGKSKEVALNITCASTSNGPYVTFRTINPDAVMHFSNITLDKTAWTATTWNTYNMEFYTDVTLTNCVIKHAVTFCENAVVKDTTIIGYGASGENESYYSIWVCAYANVTISGGEIIGNRGIKVDAEYFVYPKGNKYGDSYTTADGSAATYVDLAKTNLTVDGTVFKTKGSKPAILVKVQWADVKISNVNIKNVVADSTNPVWIDEDLPLPENTATYGLTIVYNETTLVNENIVEGKLIANCILA